MKNRRQSTPGQGGAPRNGRVAARTAACGLADPTLAAAFPGGRDAHVTDIGQAGRSRNLSP